MVHSSPQVVLVGLLTLIYTTMLIVGLLLPDTARASSGPMMHPIVITSVCPTKAQYFPGECIRVDVATNCTIGRDGVTAMLKADFFYLTESVGSVEVPIALNEGMFTTPLEWDPAEVGSVAAILSASGICGLGVEVELFVDGATVCRSETAVDIASDWAHAPRYGFVSDFSALERESNKRFEALNRLHINAVQFYDWMYKHDTLLPPQNSFIDSLGRFLSLKRVKAKVELCRKYGMAAMAYSAIYAASPEFAGSHSDWALFKAPGVPEDFGDGYLYLMNCSRGTPWSAHLISELSKALDEVGFSGIHLDQYGYPKYSFGGRDASVEDAIDVAHAFLEFIEDAKNSLDVPIVFNAVNDWPTEVISPSAADISYIEVWEPHEGFDDLRNLVQKARIAGGAEKAGKGVVLAAYIDPALESSVLLTDATIFSSGGTHIEFGEGMRLLADPYFPKHKKPSEWLVARLVQYYDFLVRYENLLIAVDVVPEHRVKAYVRGRRVDTDAPDDSVWASVSRCVSRSVSREGCSRTMVHLLNFTGITGGEARWRSMASRPEPLGPFEIEIRFAEGEVCPQRVVKRVWLVSPDNPSLAPMALLPSRDGERDVVRVTVPNLDHWSMIVFEHE